MRDLTELGLVVVCADAAFYSQHNQEKFAEIRRDGFGASDSSVLLGVNPYEKVESLIASKQAVGYTAKDMEIANLPQVRKGRDLEPFIMQKFEERFSIPVEKPSAMYNIPGTKLNVNFDGLIELSEGTIIPVECKLISFYGGKYYDRGKQLMGDKLHYNAPPVFFGGEIEEHIRVMSERCGIPGYYYTQMQHQMLALNSPFGYLAAMYDKEWELSVFIVPQDRFVQEQLKMRAAEVWRQVEAPVAY